MKIRLKLLKLTLLGSRKNYSVKFNDGLNYISGHTSTGKTSILEMIDYALGSKEHKSYIEIGSSCSAVELELIIGNVQFLIRRKLFQFTEPVIIESWDTSKEKYVFYTRCVIDTPSNPQSLSAFLIEMFNLADIKISSDQFSFRDIFKYSYLKQTEIDSEDIMHEKEWIYNLKRKATFEIIFNLFDSTLDGYKDSLKKKQAERDDLEIRLQGIKDFLMSTEFTDITEYTKQAKKLSVEIETLKSRLVEIKKNKGVDTSFANDLRQRIITTKEMLKQIADNKSDQQDYLSKLRLLSNQYEIEIDKRQMTKDGYFAFSQYEFSYCPNWNCQEMCSRK